MNPNNRELATIHKKLARKEDISSSNLIELLATNQTVTKKFICDFLVDRSQKDANISLITANMLIRDGNDPNPSIRSTSIMALSSLPYMEEAAVTFIRKSMKDHSPQVRRAAVLSCLEFSRHANCTAYETGLRDLLYEGIRDPDPIVVSNCLVVLEDIMQDEGGIAINRAMIHYLLPRLENFSDSGIIHLFTIFKKYTPKDENETISILNQLDIFFKSDSLPVLLATVELFFHITAPYPNLINDMIIAIRYSVVNILNKSEFEYCSILLDYLLNLQVPLSPSFSSYYKCFMLKYNDSNIVKIKKLKILSVIAEKSTVLDIITDLKHYAKDIKLYTYVYQCLGVLGTISKDAMNMVMHTSISSLHHSNYNIAACSVQCIYMLCHSSGSQFPKELTKRISEALLRPDIVENHAEMILCVLEYSCIAIPEIDKIFELLLNLMDIFDSEVRCRLLNVATNCYLKMPTIIHPLIVQIIAKSFQSKDFSEVSCAAFNYALIENQTKC